MADWSKLPDLGAVGLLTTAFATVARRSHTPASGLWLVGWIFITIHFAALLFASETGLAGEIAAFLGIATLAAAGILFILASLPYRGQPSSRVMASTIIATMSLYVGISTFAPHAVWALTGAAALLGIAPLAVAVFSLKTFSHPLRSVAVLQCAALAVFILAFQNRPGNGQDLALNALLFTVYMGCCLHFALAYRPRGTGAIVTTAGFFAWGAVFLVAPCMQAFLPAVQVQGGVWNLPKYVVAVGMILVVLEEQIEHNKYLALHDELTGLPNRRLFLDRLDSAIERTRRSGSQTALLLIDLDLFKQVNDTVGHHIGDLVLQRVAQIFQGRIRRSDTVARTGGDEFSVILEEPITREDAERVSRSLVDLLRQPLTVGNHSLTIGASVGVAVFPDDASSAEALRICADVRMYAGKHLDRNPPFRSDPSMPVARRQTVADTGSSS